MREAKFMAGGLLRASYLYEGAARYGSLVTPLVAFVVRTVIGGAASYSPHPPLSSREWLRLIGVFVFSVRLIGLRGTQSRTNHS